MVKRISKDEAPKIDVLTEEQREIFARVGRYLDEIYRLKKELS